jgi:hypothetical protein
MMVVTLHIALFMLMISSETKLTQLSLQYKSPSISKAERQVIGATVKRVRLFFSASSLTHCRLKNIFGTADSISSRADHPDVSLS